MLLTDPRFHFQFTDYGILIPIKDSKITRVLLHLGELESLQGKSWKVDGIEDFVTREDLLRVHDSLYVERLYSDGLEAEILSTYELIDEQGNYYRYDPASAKLPLAHLFNRVLLHVNGTYQACRIALETGFCYFLGGGLHHAHRDHGTGFCLVNDLVIALRKLQFEGTIQDAWIVDVDAHKGDGTASLTCGDDSLLTLSIHMIDSWPFDEETIRQRGTNNPSLIPSDIDLEMKKGEDDLYLERLRKGLEKLRLLALEKRGRLPDLVLVVDGSDPYEKDELPSTQSLQLSLAQMLERDLMLDRFFRDCGLPTAYVSSGGYGDSVWEVYAQFLERKLPTLTYKESKTD